MNTTTESLLNDVTRRLERAIHERDCPAIVALYGDRLLVLSDYDYLHDIASADSFERRVAEKAREIHAVRFAFAVPMVWLFTEEGIHVRAVANLPLAESEVELIAWTVFDQNDGVDYGYLPYGRRPNGEPVFDDDDQTLITIPIQPYDTYLGRLLLNALTQDP